MKRFALPVIILGLLAILLLAGLYQDPRVIPSPILGKPAPDFRLAVLGDQRRLFGPADMRGKPWVMNVWASWCVSCREEHAALLRIASSARVPIIGLNYKDAIREAQQWLSSRGNPYSVSVSDTDGRVGIDYGVYGVPETYLIDSHGIVRYKHVGPLTVEVWTAKLLPLLEKLAQ